MIRIYDEYKENMMTENMWNGVNVEKPVIDEEAFLMTGKAFNVVRRTMKYGSGGTIIRDVVMHAPVVAVLVHNTTHDTYLLEREYRSGINDIAYGVVAGFMEDGEQPQVSMLRELSEETGINLHQSALDGIDSRLHALPHMNSSEGFTNERTYPFILDIDDGDYRTSDQSLDDDEYIQYEWVSYDQLKDMLMNGGIHGASSMVLIQHEMIYRNLH
jgi:ADP-ribose pyrophosphatase